MSSLSASDLEKSKVIIVPVDKDEKLSAAAANGPFDAEEHIEFSKWCVNNEKIFERIENQHFSNLKSQIQA